jgi:hypothetical protein
MFCAPSQRAAIHWARMACAVAETFETAAKAVAKINTPAWSHQ